MGYSMKQYVNNGNTNDIVKLQLNQMVPKQKLQCTMNLTNLIASKLHQKHNKV